MSPIVDVLVPVWRRPQTIGPMLASLWASTDAGQARVFLIPSADDHDALNECIRLDDGVRVFSYPAFEPGGSRGDYARKTNYAYRLAGDLDPAPWVFCGATDLAFHDGWLFHAVGASVCGATVIGTNDLGNPEVLAGRHSTHSLVARRYVDLVGGPGIPEPGNVLHDGYWHEWADVELVEAAKHRRMFTYAENSIVEHLHPVHGKAGWDASYAAWPARSEHGRALFRRRYTDPRWA